MQSEREGRPRSEFRAHPASVSRCSFLRGDCMILTASHDGSLALWECASGECVERLTGHTHRVVDVSVEGERVLSGSWDKSLVLWDLQTAMPLWKAEHEGIVTCCHHRGNLAISGGNDGWCYLWDLRQQNCVHRHYAHTSTVTCCRLSGDGCGSCSCSMDRTALVWELRAHKRLLTLSGHANVVSACAYSSNSHAVVTACWDKLLRVFDVSSGGYRSAGPALLQQHHGCISSCCFSSDDSLLVSAGYDMDVNVCSMSTHSLQNSFKGHEDWINDARFGSDSRWIVSCSKDGLVHIWDTSAGRESSPEATKQGRVELSKCEECGVDFSVAGQPVPEQCLCVFCRLKHPGRALEQLSQHYVTSPLS